MHLPSTSLRSRLMLLVMLSMLPIFALLIYHAMAERDRKLNELQEEAVRLSELAAERVGQALEGTRQMLLTLGYTEAVVDYWQRDSHFRSRCHPGQTLVPAIEGKGGLHRQRISGGENHRPPQH